MYKQKKMNSKIIALLQIESKCHMDTSMSFVTSCYGSLNFQPISEITGITCQGIFGFFSCFQDSTNVFPSSTTFFQKKNFCTTPNLKVLKIVTHNMVYMYMYIGQFMYIYRTCTQVHWNVLYAVHCTTYEKYCILEMYMLSI